MICRLRHVLLLAACARAAASSDGPAPRAHQLDASYDFESYLSHFDKSYDDPAEYSRRASVFAKNLKKILAHNNGRMNEEGDVLEGFVMGVNHFTDVEQHEIPMGYNKALHPVWKSQLAQQKGGVVAVERKLGKTDTTTQYSREPDFEMDDVASLPKNVDWTELGKVHPTVPNQGGCGSCWTFAATGALESQLAIATNEEPMDLSEQNLLECTPNPNHCGGEGGCSGSTVELAYNYLAGISENKEGGMYTIDDLPYSSSGQVSQCKTTTEGKDPVVGITGWTQLPVNNYTATMNAVAKVGPLAIAVAGGDWSLYEGGVFDSALTTINHAVLLVGYGEDEQTGEKFYKIRNSWGPGYGENGYIRIKRTDNDDEECKMDTDPLVGVGCELDGNGDEATVNSVQVCGKSGVLFDVAYPVGTYLIDN